jgi:hypothetical protein
MFRYSLPQDLGLGQNQQAHQQMLGSLSRCGLVVAAGAVKHIQVAVVAEPILSLLCRQALLVQRKL